MSEPEGGSVKDTRGARGWFDPRRLNLERWAYAFQRLTGLAVLAYVVAHIGDTSFFVGGPFGGGPSPTSWASDLAVTENAVGHVILVMVVLVVVYHGINGMRLILAEYGLIFSKPTRPDFPYRPISLRSAQRHAIWVAVVVAILAALYSGGILFG